MSKEGIDKKNHSFERSGGSRRKRKRGLTAGRRKQRRCDEIQAKLLTFSLFKITLEFRLNGRIIFGFRKG